MDKEKFQNNVNPDMILDSLTTIILGVTKDLKIIYVNAAAENFFNISSSFLLKKRLKTILPNDCPIFTIINQSIENQSTVFEYNLSIETPYIGRNFIDIQATPVLERPNITLLSFQHRSNIDKIAQQLLYRNAARSVNGMASMLAHEIKNPLSGIRGAAQLLEQNQTENGKELTQLIQDESDRISNLVNHMDVFSNIIPVTQKSENIHLILDRVHKIAKNGFAKSINISRHFDPSLPPVFGNQDQLIQVFLNLVKNAAEETLKDNGEIILKTAYQQGAKFSIGGHHSRIPLPLIISIIDNGAGIKDDMKFNLFEPFVTSKPKGKGLGLALVAKIIDDHGGLIEFERKNNFTIFRVRLPVFSQGD